MKKLYSPLLLFVALTMLLSTTGFSQWTMNTATNTPVCVATDKQVDPRIMGDGHGGVFIAWKDYRNGLPDIFVQHLDSMGVPQWTVDGIAACTDPADQSTPSLTTDMHGGVIVTWSDWRSGIERDIYAQRIDSLGNIMWTIDGAVVTNQSEREHNERVISDGAGGIIVAFEKQSFIWTIWAQHLDNNGNPLWPAGGVELALISSNKRNPKLQQDPIGGAYITWQDNRSGNYDIYAQHLSFSGTREWGVDGLQVCGATGNQTNPKIDPDSISSGVYIAWGDDRSGLNDIYCQLIDSAGNLLWAATGVGVCTATGNQSALDMLANTNVNGVIIAWKDSRAGNIDIYAQKLNRSGIPQWTSNGVLVAGNTFPQINPNICGDGLGGAIIGYQDSTASSLWNISAQRLDNNGNLLWPATGVVVCNAAGSQEGPKNVSDKNSGSIFVWEDYRTGTRDIYAQHLGADGFSIGIKEEAPYTLLSVFPNPFINELNINFNLLKKGKISIKIQNLIGETIVEILPETDLEMGTQTIKYNSASFASGIYFLEIRSNNFLQTVKIIKH